MKSLTLEGSLTQILSAPQAKAKLSLPVIWPKIQPFLLMLAMLVPGLSKYINALIAGINSYLENKGPKATLPAKFTDIWKKVRPFITMLPGLFGKKVGVYINAFIAAIDKLIEEDETE